MWTALERKAVMDLLTSTDIQELARGGGDGTHISLFMPTHRYGSGVQADQVQWKNRINGVESSRVKTLKRRDVDTLL